MSRATPAPTSIGLLIGDAAHNLRSALDHLVVACATRGAGRALSDREERTLEYPICLSQEGFEDALKRHKLDFVEMTPLEIIRRYQPYNHRLRRALRLDDTSEGDAVAISALQRWGDEQLRTEYGPVEADSC